MSTQGLVAAAVLLLSAMPGALSAQTKAQTNPQAKSDDEVLKLEEFVTKADKESHFSLPLDAVPSTGSRLGLSSRELPVSLSVISQDLIQLHGNRTIAEALENVAGMLPGVTTGSIPYYISRGFSGNDITITRDGIRQNSSFQASRPLDSFLFDRVEVLKGPASVMFGEGAIGGAMNYISKSPSTNFKGEAFAGLGPWSTYRMGIGAGGPVADSVPLFYRFDVSRQGSDGYVANSKSSLNAFGGSVSWRPTASTNLTFYATYLADDIKGYYGTPIVYDAIIDATGARAVRKVNTATDTLVNPRYASGTRRINYNNADNLSQTENSFSRLTADVAVNSWIGVKNDVYVSTQNLRWRNTENYVWNPITQLVDRGAFTLIYRDDLLIGDRLNITLDHEVGSLRNRVVFGGTFERGRFIRNSGQSNFSRAATSVTLLNPDVGFHTSDTYQKTFEIDVTTVAPYVEDVLTLTKTLKMVGGLRSDNISVERLSLLATAPTFYKDFSPVSGRFGLVWTAVPDVNVYASYNNAAQPVSQLVSLNAGTGGFSLQKGRQYEGGLKATFWGKRADATVAVYDIEKKGVLSSTLVNGVVTPQQIGAQVSQGAEFSLAVTPVKAFTVEANVAWTWKAEFKDFGEDLGGGVLANRTGKTPPDIAHVISSLFVTKTMGDWQYTFGARYVGRRPDNNANTIFSDSYTALDAGITYNWKKTAISLRGRNLTDKVYSDWTGGAGTFRHLADPTSFELSVRQRF